MNRLPLLLDCDPGHDDFLAILMAETFADLRAVTTVSGNAPLARSTANALIALSMFGSKARVHPGASRPFVVAPYHAPQIHGDSGLAGPELPAVTTTPADTSAVERLLAEARETEGLWVVATGPLTNVALALRADNMFQNRIAGVSIMGGGLEFGNVTPGAEYNIWADPESALVVFTSGVPLIICPLDVTHRLLVRRHLITRIAAIDTVQAAFIASLLSHFVTAYAAQFFSEEAAPLHDPCAVLALTHPELFEFRDFSIEVFTDGAARGVTLPDRRGVKGNVRPNARVAVDVMADAVFELLVEAIQSIRDAG